MKCPICESRDSENFECEWADDYTARRHWLCNECESLWWDEGWVADPTCYDPRWEHKAVDIEVSEQGEKILAEKREAALMRQAQKLTIPMF